MLTRGVWSTWQIQRVYQYLVQIDCISDKCAGISVQFVSTSVCAVLLSVQFICISVLNLFKYQSSFLVVHASFLEFSPVHTVSISMQVF